MNSKEAFINALERSNNNDDVMYALCERIIGLRRDDVTGIENTLDDEEKRLLQERGGSLQMANLFQTINTLFPSDEVNESIPDVTAEVPTTQETLNEGTPTTQGTPIPQPILTRPFFAKGMRLLVKVCDEEGRNPSSRPGKDENSKGETLETHLKYGK
ncbi:hypothetical protein CU098_004178, partial [Rhizopus stolonifer]